MVKIKTAFLCACLALVAGCAGRQLVDVHPQRIAIPGIVPGARATLALADAALIGVFSDTATTTLDQAVIPLGDHLSSQAPVVSVIDKIDSSPPLSPSFGEHVLLVHDGVASILYQDTKHESKMVLKLASRPLLSTQWYLDILEPAGFPVAILPGDKGSASEFWAAGGLLSKTGGLTPQSLIEPFSASLPGSVAGAAAFTVYDDDTRTVFLIRRAAQSFSATPLLGATRVQSSCEALNGRVAILTWIEDTRRLL
jgi:hypothetical protein